MSNQITDEQINERLARFDGLEVDFIQGQFMTPTEDRWWYPIPDYTKSIELCLPLVEKLKIDFSIFNIDNLTDAKGIVARYAFAVQFHNLDIDVYDKSLSRGLSLALYYAIGDMHV